MSFAWFSLHNLLNRYTQNHAANKTADSPSQRKPQAGMGRANEQTNDHETQVMSNTAKTLGVRGGGGGQGVGVGWRRTLWNRRRLEDHVSPES